MFLQNSVTILQKRPLLHRRKRKHQMRNDAYQEGQERTSVKRWQEQVRGQPMRRHFLRLPQCIRIFLGLQNCKVQNSPPRGSTCAEIPLHRENPGTLPYWPAMPRSGSLQKGGNPSGTGTKGTQYAAETAAAEGCMIRNRSAAEGCTFVPP